MNQSHKEFEIIVLNKSTDNTIEIIKSFNSPKIKLFSTYKKNIIGHANRRNLKKAKGEFIFFTDGDCSAHYDWLKGAQNL